MAEIRAYVQTTATSGELTAGNQLAPASGTLTLQPDVESANIDPTGYQINNPDSATPEVIAPVGYGWIAFGFQLSGADGKQPTFRVDNSNKAFNDFHDGSYGEKWLPNYTYDFKTWYRASTWTLNASNEYEWTFDEAFSQDTVFVASNPIYRQSDWEETISTLIADGVATPVSDADSNGVIGTSPASQDPFGREVGGNDLYSVVLSWSSSLAESDKKNLVLKVGTHSGECMDGYLLKGALDWVQNSTETAAQTFRNDWRIVLIGFQNSEGRVGLSRRVPFRSSNDPNRDWNDIVTSHSFFYEETTLIDTVLKNTLPIRSDGFRANLVYDAHTEQATREKYAAYVGGAHPVNGNDFTTALSNLFETSYTSSSDTNIRPYGNEDTFAYYGNNNLLSPCAGTWEYPQRGASDAEQCIEVGRDWMRATMDLDADGFFGETLEGGSPTTPTNLQTTSITSSSARAEWSA